MQQAQKETLKWIGIITIGGLVLYNVGKKLGIFSENLPTTPNAEGNTPTAKDYTHTPGFNPQALVKQIIDDWNTLGGDPFDKIFSQIKSNIATQGDWQTFSQAFVTETNETPTNYMTSWWDHALWATLSKSEVAQIVNYVNTLPL
jgi:hypothetical protein